MNDDLTPDDADEYTVTLDSGDEVNVTEFTDEYHTSCDRKVQLDRYEPISEHVSLGGTFENADLTPQDRLAIIMMSARLSRDICETQLMRRYEEYVREETFGE